MLMGPRARMVGLAAMLPPGIERTSKPSRRIRADVMVWTSQNVRLWTQSGHRRGIGPPRLNRHPYRFQCANLTRHDALSCA
jgi:hypothetical protein